MFFYRQKLVTIKLNHVITIEVSAIISQLVCLTTNGLTVVKGHICVHKLSRWIKTQNNTCMITNDNE